MIKNVFRILIVSLVVIVLMLSLLLFRPQAQISSHVDYSYHLQIIVENTDTYFFNQFLYGAKEAADTLEAYVEVVSLEKGKTDSLRETVEKGIYAKVDGIALHAVADTNVQTLCDLAELNGVQLALYESENSLTLPVPNIATNAYSIGTTAAQLAIEASGGNCKAILVLDRVNKDLSANRSLKLQGILEWFNDYPNAEVVETYVINSDFMATEQLMDILFGKAITFNTIICLKETSTPMFAQRILDNALIGSVRLIGYGALPETLDYINRNIIYGSVCPDAQEIGYQTVVALINSLRNNRMSDYSSANLYSITKENVSDFILMQQEDIG